MLYGSKMRSPKAYNWHGVRYWIREAAVIHVHLGLSAGGK
jgi:hypothetical protein